MSSKAASAAGRAATPTAFPDSGTFSVTQRVTLLSATPSATIHYTTDGSAPTTASPVFDPYVLPVMEAGGEAGTSQYVLRALAAKPGLETSEVATFHYTIERRARDQYLPREIGPGLYMIIDFDDTKMYLLIGSQRALLVDAGLGARDLRGLVESMIGGLPLDVVIAHGHPDHIARMGQFQGRHSVYMHHADLPLVQTFIERMHYDIALDQIIDLREGFVFDLGDYRFKVFEVPGHSAGSLVLFDAARGLLLAGNAVGSNRPTIPDSLWMQNPGMAKIDVYLTGHFQGRYHTAAIRLLSRPASMKLGRPEIAQVAGANRGALANVERRTSGPRWRVQRPRPSPFSAFSALSAVEFAYMRNTP